MSPTGKKTQTVDSQSPRGFSRTVVNWRIFRGLVGIICLMALFYAEENWRGRHGWETCTRKLALRASSPNALMQTERPVPDNLNTFKAPRMSEWFFGPPHGDFRAKLDQGWLSINPKASEDLAEVTIVCGTNQPVAPESALLLDYDAPSLKLGDLTKAGPSPSASQVIPLIVMDAVPLSDAIKNLARQEGLKYLLDSNVAWSLNPQPPRWYQPLRWLQARIPGRIQWQPPEVNLRWENVTAFQALRTLLENYNLMWVEDPTGHVGRIAIKSDSYATVQLSVAARERIQQALVPFPSQPGPAVRFLKASQGFILFHQDNPQAVMRHQAVKVIVRSSCVPTPSEVEAFFPRDTMPWLPPSVRVRVLPTGTNTFRFFCDPPCFCPAEEYLARTDSCETDFELMREAVSRPYALLEAGFQPTPSKPFRDFIGVRLVSQTLAQRAQAHLLVGKPEKALDDLALIPRLGVVIEAEPFSLVAAMIEVAVTGIYLDVIRDGIRLGAWKEPQLLALQEQLAKIDLVPLLARGLSTECPAICQAIETNTPGGFAATFELGPPRKTLLEKIKSPGFSILSLGPSGWRYGSMTIVSDGYQRALACFDGGARILKAREVDQLDVVAERMRKSFWPTSRLTGIAIPRFARRWQVAAYQQSRVDQALVACALERYRLTHAEFPAELAQLVPGFAQRLPLDVINGKELRYKRVGKADFKLYSIGWNETDEGGLVLKSAGPRDYGSADWVWNQGGPEL